MNQSTGAIDRRLLRHVFRSCRTLLAVVLMGCIPGCPPAGDNGDNGTEGTPTASINNLTSDIRVSGEQSVTVVYSAGPDAAAVSAFYIEVESAAPNANTVGVEVVFADGLATGDNQTTALNTTPLPVGFYRVGLNVTASGETLRVLSLGTIQVTTLPDPTFTLPNQSVFAQPGGNVQISANVGDAENAVQWRIFFVPRDERPSLTPDQYGTQIAAGTANVAQATWFTAGVPLGEYEIGIFVTDSGQSIADTVASGATDDIKGPFFNSFTVTLTEEPPAVIPPSLVVSEPAANKVVLVANPSDPDEGNVLVQFAATVFQGPPALQFIDVFHDFDGEANTGDETLISGSLPINATNAVFRVASIEVSTTAFIGVTVRDGVTDPVTRYANGTVRRLGPDEAGLEVTQPNNSLTRNIGEVVNVAWQTVNLPSDSPAEINVYVRRVDSNGDPTETIDNSTPINTSGIPLTDSAFQFLTTSSGRFLVTVEIDYTSNLRDPIRENAPELVVVSTIPDIIWVGALDPLEPFDNIPAQLDGAIFEGVQFEDNAGSSFEGDVDFDGDGLDECLIAARYAKPFFSNPSGIGAGEVYMLRGRSDARYQGVLNLNTVASPAIPGLVFAGLPVDRTLTANPAASPDDTDGIANIFVTKTSADSIDSVGEIIFTFPWTRSRPARVFGIIDVLTDLGGPLPVFSDPLFGGPLEFCPWMAPYRDPDGWEIPQFFRGGVVTYSSANDLLNQRFSDTFGQRVLLDNVGQQFDSTEVVPDFGDTDVCSGASTWTVDEQAWEVEGNCPTGEGGTGGQILCNIGATDDIAESLVRPQLAANPDSKADDSFHYELADPFVCQRIFNLRDAYDELLLPCYTASDFLCPASDVLCDENFPSDCDNDQFTDEPFCSNVRPLAEEGTGSPTCDPPAPDTCEGQQQTAEFSMPVGDFRWGANGIPVPRGTGLYPDLIGSGVRNEPLDNLYGARIIGRNNFDALGVTITQSDNDLVIASKFSDFGETNGGVGYLRPLAQEWQIPNDPQEVDKPHQDLIRLPTEDPDSGLPVTKGIIGDEQELIETIVAIPDFNEDTRSDIAVGAPLADVDGDGSIDGAVYVVFRRAPSLEGIFRLPNLKLPTDDPERLSGVLIREAFGSGERFGQSIDGDIDFNHDGKPDVVVGNPDGNGGTGEIVILFSDRNLITQAEGLPIDDEPGLQGVLSRSSGLRITGVETASEFGIFVKNIGDVDGDGLNDIAVAAPNATPMFDSNPSDDVDVLDTPGLDGVVDEDRNGFPDEPDGILDDVTGPLGFPDGLLDINDELRHAGLVYIILGSSFQELFAFNNQAVVDVSIADLGTDQLDGFIVVGRRGDRYAVGDSTGTGPIAHHGDFLAGGDMGGDAPRSLFGVTIEYGGNGAKGPAEVFDLDGNLRTTPEGDPLVRQRGQAFAIGTAGDVDGDGSDEILLGAPLADPRVDPRTGIGTRNGGEAYLIYGFQR
jgi:hypothetical protein